MAVVRILGIDPGTQVVGYGCLELLVDRTLAGAAMHPVPMALRGSNVVSLAASAHAQVRLVAAGVLRLGGRSDGLAARLVQLADRFDRLVAELAPNELAIEEAFYGKSAQAALRIGEARGVMLAQSARVGVEVFQYAPARIKRCVTGNGAARKETVAGMLRQLVPGGAAALRELPADATDAIAVAWTRLEERRSPLPRPSARGRGPTARCDPREGA